MFGTPCIFVLWEVNEAISDGFGCVWEEGGLLWLEGGGGEDIGCSLLIAVLL